MTPPITPWKRILTRPAPKRPVRDLFAITAAGFILGLIIGIFVPPSLAFDSVPIRIDLPFRAAAYAAFSTYAGTGFLLLPPLWRKIVLIATLASIPFVVWAGVSFYSSLFGTPTLDVDLLGRNLPRISRALYPTLALMILGPGAGWFRYSMEIARQEQIEDATKNQAP